MSTGSASLPQCPRTDLSSWGLGRGRGVKDDAAPMYVHDTYTSVLFVTGRAHVTQSVALQEDWGRYWVGRAETSASRKV